MLSSHPFLKVPLIWFVHNKVAHRNMNSMQAWKGTIHVLPTDNIEFVDTFIHIVLYLGFTASEVSLEDDHGVKGIATRDVGIAKDGTPKQPLNEVLNCKPVKQSLPKLQEDPVRNFLWNISNCENRRTVFNHKLMVWESKKYGKFRN